MEYTILLQVTSRKKAQMLYEEKYLVSNNV